MVEQTKLIAMPFTYKYPRPALTVDAIVFKETGIKKEILLIQRKFAPYKGKWALPGGFVDMDETLEQAVERELLEETGINNIELQQFKAVSTLERDPRGRTISIVFRGAVNKETKIIAGDDAAKAQWFDVSKLPPLAFDHKDIIIEAINNPQV